MRRRVLGAIAISFAAVAAVAAEAAERARDLSKDKTLYCVGYAHLDTQWRWDFTTTIDRYLRATLEENFERFERPPGYVFNFTGSARYRMMKEYYPELYERLKGYVAAGRSACCSNAMRLLDVQEYAQLIARGTLVLLAVLWMRMRPISTSSAFS